MIGNKWQRNKITNAGKATLINGKKIINTMIDYLEALEKARQYVTGWDFVDPNSVNTPVFISRSSYLQSGVKDSPNVRDTWLITFARIPREHPLDNEFPLVSISVDAETGKTSLVEGI